MLASGAPSRAGAASLDRAFGGSRLRVLFLTCHLPYPAWSGGRLREFELLSRLAETCDIGLRCVSKTYEEDQANAAKLGAICQSIEIFPADKTVPADDDALVMPPQVLQHRSNDLARRIAQDLASPTRWELVHVEGFYMMQHVPEATQTPVVLTEQNIEYVLWRQRAARTHSKKQRRRYLWQYLRTLQCEMAAWEKADVCATVTEEDRILMLASHANPDVRLVPDGCDHLRAAAGPFPPVDDRGVVFVGNFAYEPNVDAARFLCRQIVPRVRDMVRDARFTLVGNDPPADVLRLADRAGVGVTGRVPEVAPFLRRAAVVACPLRIGGGVKVKVLEALHEGKALVTTSVGAQGIPGLDRGAFVADHPRDFAAGVAQLLQDRQLRAALERAALDLSSRLPSWDDASKALLDCYLEVCSPRSRLVATRRWHHPV